MDAVAQPTAADRAGSPALLANRVSGVLAWGGVLVAGVLSYGDLRQLDVPCGPAHGCSTVAQSEYSKWFGVPVAVVGLVGYLLLLGLCLARSMSGRQRWKALTKLSLVGTVFGFLASLYFVYTSFAVIQAKCEWCLASFGLMTLSLITTLWLWLNPEPEVTMTPADVWTHSVSMVAVLGVGFSVIASMNRTMDDVGKVTIGNMRIEQLLPSASKMRGNADAKVTVIEFADFNCPSCRKAAPIMDEQFRRNGGRLRWAFRNMPLVKLPGHETSMMAATISELAAEKGLFWPFFDALYRDENTERVKSEDGLRQIASEVGLKGDDVEACLSPTSPAAQGVVQDIQLSLSLNVRSTPTFLVLAEGLEPRAVTGHRLEEVLSEPDYQKLLGGR